MKPRFWIMSYDIAHPKRLRRVAKLAITHGERVQKSLYLCALSPEQLDVLQHELIGNIDTRTDRVMLRPVCRTCRSRTRSQGAGGHPERQEPFWIV
jgi:CRISPR-associated protein Cas2